MNSLAWPQVSIVGFKHVAEWSYFNNSYVLFLNVLTFNNLLDWNIRWMAGWKLDIRLRPSLDMLDEHKSFGIKRFLHEMQEFPNFTLFYPDEFSFKIFTFLFFKSLFHFPEFSSALLLIGSNKFGSEFTAFKLYFWVPVLLPYCKADTRWFLGLSFRNHYRFSLFHLYKIKVKEWAERCRMIESWVHLRGESQQLHYSSSNSSELVNLFCSCKGWEWP